MFEYCPHYKCVYNGSGNRCSYLDSDCDRRIKDKRCVNTGMYLKCAFAAYDKEILRCCFSFVSPKELKGMPSEKYNFKPEIADLPKCLKEIVNKKSASKPTDMDFSEFER